MKRPETGPANPDKIIVIPSRHSLLGQDLAIPVVPQPDSWLLHPDRTPLQIDQALENRLQSIEACFPSETDPKLKRFLAYVELTDEYHVGQQSHQSAIDTSQTQFKTTESSIKNRLAKAQGSLRHTLSAELTDLKQQHSSSSRLHQDQIDQAAAIQRLVLKKAFLEIFDNQTDQTIPLELLPQIAAQATDHIARETQPFIYHNRQPVNNFIADLATQLQAKTCPESFGNYTYRRSPDLVTKLTDLKVLTPAMEWALSSDPLFKQLGDAFFHFLKNQAVAQSRSSPSYPILALFHDLVATAITSDDPDTYRHGPNYTQALLMDLRISQLFRKETERLFTAHWQQRTQTYASIVTRLDGLSQLFSHRNDPDYTAQLFAQLPEVTALLTTTESRLIAGIGALRLAISRYNPTDPLITDDRLIMAYMKTSVSETLSGREKLNRRFGCDASATLDEVRATAHNYAISCAEIEIDPISILSYQNHIANTIHQRRAGFGDNHSREQLAAHRILSGQDNSAKTKYLQQTYQESLASGFSPSQAETHTFSYYLTGFWSQEAISPDQVARQNHQIVRLIHDCNTWLVSPKGDRFSVSRNPHLDRYAINSVTFDINPQHPQDHLVSLRISGVDTPLEFWINSQGTLLNRDHQYLTGDIVAKNNFTNMILRQLLLITSGALAQPGDRVDKSPTPPLPETSIYRRAHYRLLPPGDKPRPEHIAAIKQIYGIDIADVTDYRHRMGTLVPDRKITFVREVVNLIQPNTPNELVYSDSLLPPLN